MKKYHKIVLTIIITFIFLVSIGIISAGGFDNFKLQATKYWGFVTIQNNPLLSNFDKDLKNSSEYKNPRISLNELKAGGPPKDGIPSIDNPQFENYSQTPFDDDELVIGVYYNGEARAYPYSILNWHEIVNDKIRDLPIAVTLCPLCDTNPVFIREVNGEETTFGVSGKLYQSCLIMYDRLTDSMWSQVLGLGITSSQTNQRLEQIPAQKTTLGEWIKEYPDSKILTTETGYNRDYFRYPYGTYYNDENIIFPVRNQENLDTHPKEIVSYIWKEDNQTNQNKFTGNKIRVIHNELKSEGIREIEFGSENITVVWNESLSNVRFYDQSNNEIPSSTAFSFVYTAYFN